MTVGEQLDAAGVGITHHFAGGVYAKEMRIPAGSAIGKHVHDFDHLSALVAGSVRLTVAGVARDYTAPAVLIIKAGAEHVVHAIADSVWMCLHRSDVVDELQIDDALKVT